MSMQNEPSREIDMEFVEATRKKVMKADIAIGLLSMTPLTSFIWGFTQYERFSADALGMLAMLYVWSIGACYFLFLRKIKDNGLRWSAMLFASGTFSSMLVLTITLLPAMWSLAATPIGTFYTARIRTRLHRNTDMLMRIGKASQKQGQLKA